MAVSGLGIFVNRFKEHTDKYVLIGGTACSINLEEAGFGFRSTKDLDIVLVLKEKADARFTRAMWQFIKDAGYEIKQKSDGQPACYRFAKPKNPDYPYMLELFSRRVKGVELPDDAELSPLPAEDDLTSLSAILLKDDYYNLVLKHAIVKNSCSYVTGECLVPLKAYAYLDLKRRKQEGEDVDSKNIRKHKNDVFRLVQLLTEDKPVNVPDAVRDDLRRFLEAIGIEPPDLKQLGIKGIGLDEILGVIKKVYGLDK